MIILNPETLNDFYIKAKLAFNDCITNPENLFLQQEVNVPLKEIILQDEFVQVKFLKHETDEYVIEVNFSLICTDGDSIAKYSYYENEKGIALDDCLVFKA